MQISPNLSFTLLIMSSYWDGHCEHFNKLVPISQYPSNSLMHNYRGNKSRASWPRVNSNASLRVPVMRPCKSSSCTMHRIIHCTIVYYSRHEWAHDGVHRSRRVSVPVRKSPAWRCCRSWSLPARSEHCCIDARLREYLNACRDRIASTTFLRLWKSVCNV